MKYVLAPLAGFTDAPFRRLCAENGADRTYTEMVSAAGLAHGSSPTRHLMETLPGEGPVAVQIFGSKESEVAFAARELEADRQRPDARRFVELNLNAGCPMTKVTREGAGARLIEDPAKVGRLLKAMAENTAIPVTLKTRLGPHPQCQRIFELLDAAEQAGAVRVIVHARYTSQMHGGATHLELLREVVRRSRLPITGNGSITDAASAAAMAATGVDELMIGRASLANPAVFAALKHADGATVPAVTAELQNRWFARHLQYVLEFREQLVRRFPRDHLPSADGFASVKLHTHLFRYFNGRPGAAALRARLNAIRTLSEIRQLTRA